LKTCCNGTIRIVLSSSAGLDRISDNHNHFTRRKPC
jgi:hypothetical protein